MDFIAKLITFLVKFIVTIFQYGLISWTIAPFVGVVGALIVVIDDGEVSGYEIRQYLYMWYYPYLFKD